MKKLKINHRAKMIIFRRWGGQGYSLFQALKKQVQIATLVVSYLLVAGNTEVIAQDQSSEVNMKYDLDEIEVSAQRAPVAFSQVARIVSVIERDEIEAAPVQSINELLEYALSVDVRQRGVHGVQSDISVRGGSFDQTLILLNGINLSDPQTGHHSLNLPVSLKNISRIEILEGPAARIYGPNAFSGAINIITGEEDDSSLKADVLYGQHQLVDANVKYNLAKNNAKHLIAANRKSSDGYIDNTDFEASNIYYHGQKDTKAGKLELQLGYTSKGFGANSFYTPKYPNQYEATKTKFASVKFSTKGKVNFTPTVYWRRLHDRFELFRDNPASWYQSHNYHLTDVYGTNLNSWFSSKYGKTAFGTEFRSENIWSNVLGETMTEPIEVPGEDGHYFTKSHSRTHISFFAEHSVYLKKWSISAGLMTNWISDLDFEWKVYPGLDIAYQIDDQLKFYTSLNSSLRMPTYTDLYYNGPTNVGNPDLKPEKSVTIEGGFKYHSKAINGHINSFYRKGTDLIDWVRTSSELIWETRNLTQINTLGFEAAIDINTKELFGKNCIINKVKASYAYLNLDKQSDEYFSNYVLDNLKHKLDLNINHKIWKNLSANWQLSYQDRNGTFTSFKDGAYGDEVDYQPFWLINTKLYWKHKNLEVYSVINNILDTEYQDIGNLIQPGRWISFGLSYQLNFD